MILRIMVRIKILYFYSIPGYVDEINRIRETEDWDNCSIYKIEDEW